MTRPDTNSSCTRGPLFAVLLSCTLASPAAAEFPSFDAAANSKLAQSVQTVKNQLTELSNLRQLAQEQLRVFGEFGTMGDLFGGAAFANVGSKSDFYANMKKFAFDPCAINLCQGGDNPGGTTDLQEAEDWAFRNYFASEPLNDRTARDLEEVRRRAVINAAVSGAGLAAVTHNNLAGAGEQASALEDIVESSQNLRGDIRANSAIALAAYKVQIQQLAMLTSMVEIESAAAIADTDLTFAQGGTEFPDAYIDGDYAANDPTRRISVTVPERGSASGASGLGGSLFGAAAGGDGTNPLGGLLGDGGDAESGPLDAIAGAADPTAALIDAMANGNLPSVNPDDVSLGSVLADAAGATSGIVSESGLEDAADSFSTISQGLSENSEAGTARALMGIARGLAGESAGLSESLDIASSALASGDAGRAVSYAEGAIEDLANNGAGSQYRDYLQGRIAGLRAGELTPETLILDATALLAQAGSGADSAAADVLSIDPAQAGAADLQGLIARAIDAVAEQSGRAEIRDIARGVESLTEAEVSELREALSQPRSGAAAGSGAN